MITDKLQVDLTFPEATVASDKHKNTILTSAGTDQSIPEISQIFPNKYIYLINQARGPY